VHRVLHLFRSISADPGLYFHRNGFPFWFPQIYHAMAGNYADSAPSSCARKASYTFMRLSKMECLLRPNCIWRISYKCAVSAHACMLTYHKYYEALMQSEKAEGEETLYRKSERTAERGDGSIGGYLGVRWQRSCVILSRQMTGFLWNIISAHFQKSLTKKIATVSIYHKYWPKDAAASIACN